MTIIYGERAGRFRAVANAPGIPMRLMSGNVLSCETEGDLTVGFWSAHLLFGSSSLHSLCEIKGAVQKASP